MNSNIDAKIGRRGFLKGVAAATGAVPLDAARWSSDICEIIWRVTPKDCRPRRFCRLRLCS
jgi:hypothetical protein